MAGLSPRSTLAFALLLGVLTRSACLGLVDYRYDTGDSATYLSTAKTLYEHGVYSLATREPFEPTAYRPPGYTFLLACARAIHDGIAVVIVLQMLMGLVSIACMVALSSRLAPHATPFVAMLAAANPFDAVYTGAALSESLAGMLVVISSLLLARANSATRLAAAGVVLGLLCLTRDIYMALVPFGAGAWLLFADISFTTRLKQVFIVCLLCGVTVLPWTLRNATQFHQFIPVSAGRLGYSLWLGTWATNGDFTAGDAAGDPRRYPAESFASDDERRAVEEASVDIARGDATFRALFLSHLRQAPAKVLLVWFKRAPRLWFSTRFDIFQLNAEILPRGSFFWTLTKIGLFAIDSVLVVLALVGAFFAFRKGDPLVWVTVPLVFTSLVYLPLNSFESRYSQPMIPLLVLLAGAAISRIMAWRTA
jgi:Dolichyl-phosphate-mannose-protein mannosyltransferase